MPSMQQPLNKVNHNPVREEQETARQAVCGPGKDTAWAAGPGHEFSHNWSGAGPAGSWVGSEGWGSLPLPMACPGQPLTSWGRPKHLDRLWF